MATSLTYDLRQALRSLFQGGSHRSARWDRGLAVLAIVTLSLGIGANTAVFSVIDRVLLEPLPYPDAERLVQVWNTYPHMDLPKASVSVPDYFDRREGVGAFTESALYHYQSVNLTRGNDGGEPERVLGVAATASLFPLLKARAARGRVFTELEDRPGHEQVVVLSHDLWQRALGGEPSVVGLELRLDGAPYRVVGIMPSSFAFPHPNVDLWIPFAPTPEQRSDDERGREFSQMIARLTPDRAPEVGLRLAQEQIDAIHRRNAERFPEAATFWETAGFGGLLVPLREELYGHLRPMLLLLQGVVVLVLLIASVNVANLLLTRLSRRQRELAVRTALGADRWSLTRLLLAESLVLSLLGGLAGVVLGLTGARLIPSLVPGLASRLDAATGGGLAAGLDVSVLALTLGVALATAVLSGLAPMLSVWRSNTDSVLRDEGRGAAGGRGSSRLRRWLVVVEVAMALVLLTGAGLLLRTFAALQDEDPGFVSENLLTAQTSLPEARYGEPSEQIAFYEAALERIRALPGVEAASVVSHAPFSGSSSSGSYEVVGYEVGLEEARPHALQRVVDERFFRTMGISLLAGRTFERLDRADGEPVVVVDKRLVDKYFDGDPQAALGGRLRRGGDDSPALRIVGVVEPVKVSTLEAPVVKETLYVSYRQMPTSSMTFVVRTAGDPWGLSGSLRRAVLAVDPEQPLYDVTTMERQIAESLATRSVSMRLVAIFGALALVLAAVGIYAVLAFSTAQREREIGTRMALGASARNVAMLIVGQGMGLSVAGVLLGAGATFALARLVRSMLFGVHPWDPVSYLGASAILLGVALLACYRPARRAAGVDPAESLRAD